MQPDRDPIEPLREALAETPGNLPLRLHLAHELARLERFEEAEVEYRDVLSVEQDDHSIRMALARTYLAQGKTGHAGILVEFVTGQEGASAQAYLLLAQVRIAERDFRGARVAFRSACAIDPDLEGSEVAEELGIGLANPFEVEEDIELDLEEAPPRDSLGTELELRAALPVQPGVGLGDVGGYTAERVRLAVLATESLRRPDLFAAYGRRSRGGTLLFGPPGSGKSHLVSCVVGEAGLMLSRIDLRELMGDRSSATTGPGTGAPSPSAGPLLTRFFEAAQGAAPGVVLIENIDLWTSVHESQRGSSAAEAWRVLVDLLEVSMGLSVAVVATSERPWAIDHTLVRPGRLDRAVALSAPTEVERRGMLRCLLRDRPTESMDLRKVARKAAGRSVADLIDIVEIATELTIVRALESDAALPIREKDLLAAVREVPSTALGWYSELAEHAGETRLRGSAAHLGRLLRRAARVPHKGES